MMKKWMQSMMVLSLAGSMAFSGITYAAVTPTTKVPTLNEMLTLAIQDEYMAQAEYNALIKAFNVTRPFSNVLKAEAQHIEYLKPLLEKYKVVLPTNTASKNAVIPKTLTEAYSIGVQAEKDNIALYESFLKQNLPDDVKTVFELLIAASKNHQAAFERGTNGGQGGLGNGRR